MSTSNVLTMVVSTFVASIKSVGTACTLASVGIYLHQRGFVVGNGKRTLALISQQVTIPLLFFTKILYCNQDWSDDPCPNVVSSLGDAWILLLWPIWVCSVGLTVGYVVAKISGVPEISTQKAIMASIAFGNSTGLPITLLTVIHANFGDDSALGIVDPTLFLSVYLVMYPVLQWGIGGMMLAPPPADEEKHKEKLLLQQQQQGKINDDDDDDDEDSETGSAIFAKRSSVSASFRNSIEDGFEQSVRLVNETKRTLAHNVVNNKNSMPSSYKFLHRGLGSVDASLYMSIPENLNQYGMPVHPIASKNSDHHHQTRYQQSVSDFYNASQSLKQPHAAATFNNNAHINKNNNLGKSSRCYPSYGNEGHFKEDNKVRSSVDDTNIGLDLFNSLNSKTHVPRQISEIDEEDVMEAAAAATTVMIDGVNMINDNDTEETKAAGNNGALTTSVKTEYTEKDSLLPPSERVNKSIRTDEVIVPEEEHLCTTIFSVIWRCLQPPVIGALLGLFFTSVPSIRSIFVDIEEREGRAPLQWFFDGLYKVGQAAVPINMIILGCNLSASYMLLPVKGDASQQEEEDEEKNGRKDDRAAAGDHDDDDDDDGFFSRKVNLLMVIGKMIIMPIIGFASTYALSFVYKVPETIAGGLYLVLVIVFLAPTANNVMVMVELASGDGGGGGDNSGNTNGPSLKENMAMNIAYQYATAPVLLSGTVTGAVLLATSLGAPS